MQIKAFQPASYPEFTRAMRKTHTILMPNMAPLHFRLLQRAVQNSGYNIVLLDNDGPQVVQEGLKYVHNDTCYPALLVIGQMIDALNSGAYNPDETALIITQTGGGCRASNYIHLLRKALRKAGYPQVPVISLNLKHLVGGGGFQVTVSMLLKMLSALLYGDALMLLYNQVRPYEDRPGDSQALVERWIQELMAQFDQGAGFSRKKIRRNLDAIVESFSQVPITRSRRIRVGVVGEIYVKYSPLANNHLEDLLLREGCEVNVPGVLGFVMYCVSNNVEKRNLYGGSHPAQLSFEWLMKYFVDLEDLIIQAVRKAPGFVPPTPFLQMRDLAKDVIGYGDVMGEGWLLTAEMLELIHSGVDNIVCAQPFGCLPNHVCGKGMINKIHQLYPDANIVPIDYDPSATRVNQENRIKLMLAVAGDHLRAQHASEVYPQDERLLAD